MFMFRRNKLFLNVVVVLGLSLSGSVLAGDIGPVTSAPEPSQAIVDTPTLFWVTSSDDDGVASCDWYVSSKNRGPMTYNTSLNRWEVTYTFDELRTANSIRVKCTDGAGIEVFGEPRVIPVLEIDLTSTNGDPAEVDAVGLSRDEVIAESPVLIKTACPGGEEVNDPCRTVYFLDQFGMRHAFPNEKTYFSWYEGFSNIHVISQANMESFMLGKNVAYHPGKRLVKFPSLNTVYFVGRYGILMEIASESVAIDIFGDDWSDLVDDISEVFYFDYMIGNKISSVDSFVFDDIVNSVESINDNLIFDM